MTEQEKTESTLPDTSEPAAGATPEVPAAKPAETPAVEPDASADLEKELAEAMGGESMESLMGSGESAATVGESEAASDDVAGSEKSASDESIPNEIRRGRISAIRGDDVFIDLTGEDGRMQGLVPMTQFDRPPRMGSIMDFVVVRVDEAQGIMYLSREGAIERSTWEQIAPGLAVEARVTGTNKGGIELSMVGGIKAFMPASQIDINHVDDLEALVGEKLKAQVAEVDRKHKRVLLSRRAFLMKQREQMKTKTMAELEVDQVREGVVTKVMDFGAFVDLGGVDGLVHVSDLSYTHVNKPSEVVKQGDTVQVKVLKIDTEKGRIGLGLKQVAPDPWEDIDQHATVGESISGRVVRVANFGAFIEVAEGVEGLLPTSEMSWKRIVKPDDVCKAGDVLHLKVLSIDKNKKRISLSLKQSTGDPWLGAAGKYPRGGEVEGKVISTTDFGAFVELETGIEGMVHISELADHRVKAVTDVVNVSDVKTFKVLEINEEDRRIKLTLRKESKGMGKAAAEEAAHADVKPSKKRINPKDLKGGMGNNPSMGMGLGDLKI